MSNRRKTKRPRGAGGRDSGLRLVAGQGTGRSPRSGKLHAVGSQVPEGTRAAWQELTAVPQTAASGVHVVVVSLHGAVPPPWRRLEVPSAITLNQLHEVLQRTFGWPGYGGHSFVTLHGEFGGPAPPTSRALKRASERRDESGVTLAQVAGDEGDGVAYLYGYDDEWRVDILVERIRSAVPGVAYPRCTGGQGSDTPGDRDMREFEEEREELWLDIDLNPEELTEDLADLATVLIPRC